MKVPVTVYAEITPNPSTMKFVANKYLLITGESVEFLSKAEAKGYSPMAEELFNFPFVKKIFMAAKYVLSLLLYICIVNTEIVNNIYPLYIS